MSKPLTGSPGRVIYYPETGILTNHSAQQTHLWQSSAIRLLYKEGLLPSISRAGFMCTLVLLDRFKALCRGAGGWHTENSTNMVEHTRFVVNLTSESWSSGGREVDSWGVRERWSVKGRPSKTISLRWGSTVLKSSVELTRERRAEPGQRWFFSLIAINKIGKHWRFWGRRESLITQHLILTSTEPRLKPLSIFTFPLMGWFLCYCLSTCWPTSSFWLWASVYLRTLLAKRIKRRNHFYMPDLRSTRRAQTFSPAGLLSAFPESIIKICSERYFTNRRTHADTTSSLDSAKMILFPGFRSTYGIFYVNGQLLILTWLLFCNNRSFY